MLHKDAFTLTASKCNWERGVINSLTMSLHMENKTLNKVSKAIMQSSVPFSPWMKNSQKKKVILGSGNALK